MVKEKFYRSMSNSNEALGMYPKSDAYQLSAQLFGQMFGKTGLLRGSKL